MTPYLDPLSPEEEAKYLELYLQGDRDAGNQLIEHNLRLVVHIVKKYISPEREAEDLISIGTIGLIKAVQSFRPEKGIKLATYAARCIHNEVLMVLRSEKKRARDVSIYDPIGIDKEGNAICLYDVVECNDPDIIEIEEKKVQLKNLHRKIQELNPRDYFILCHRYGIDGHRELTQKELAMHMGISRSYVSRMEKRAIERLRILFNS